jgi:dihydrofolate reductase
MSFSAIAHCDINGLIGLNNQLAYRSREDLKEFKAQTLGNSTVLVMGKNTYKECGNLPGRKILSLSRAGNLLNGEPTQHTIDTLAKENYMILCGGPTVYEAYLLRCESVIMHWSKAPVIEPQEQDKASYFPIQLLNEVFRPTTVNDFKTFTQIWYFKRDYF